MITEPITLARRNIKFTSLERMGTLSPLFQSIFPSLEDLGAFKKELFINSKLDTNNNLITNNYLKFSEAQIRKHYLLNFSLEDNFFKVGDELYYYNLDDEEKIIKALCDYQNLRAKIVLDLLSADNNDSLNLVDVGSHFNIEEPLLVSPQFALRLQELHEVIKSYSGKKLEVADVIFEKLDRSEAEISKIESVFEKFSAMLSNNFFEKTAQFLNYDIKQLGLANLFSLVRLTSELDSENLVNFANFLDELNELGFTSLRLIDYGVDCINEIMDLQN